MEERAMPEMVKKVDLLRVRVLEALAEVGTWEQRLQQAINEWLVCVQNEEYEQRVAKAEECVKECDRECNRKWFALKLANDAAEAGLSGGKKALEAANRSWLAAIEKSKAARKALEAAKSAVLTVGGAIAYITELAGDGEAWSRSRSETMPTRRPPLSTTGKRRKPFSRMILMAS